MGLASAGLISLGGFVLHAPSALKKEKKRKRKEERGKKRK
jgi:hypothetical protein